MLPIMTTEGGMCQAFPNVCLTGGPPVPVPYPSIARCSDGGCSKKVTIRNAAVLRVGDKIRSTTGDAAGNAPGGVVSGTFGAEAEVADTPQSSVRVEGKLSAVQTAPIRSNGRGPKNAAGLHTTASQKTVAVKPTTRGGGGKSRNPVTDAESVLKCSPTLKRMLEDFLCKGWEIRYGPRGSGSMNEVRAKMPESPGTLYPSRMTIIIDQKYKNNPPALVSILAHELSHAFDGLPFMFYDPAMTREEFVRVNTKKNLISEGKAIYNQFAIREEILNNPDSDCEGLDISEGTAVSEPPEEYLPIYYNRALGWEDKVALFAKAYAAEQPSGTAPGTTYASDYRSRFEGIWELHLKSKGSGP